MCREISEVYFRQQLEARELGCTTLLVPAGNAAEGVWSAGFTSLESKFTGAFELLL